MRSPHAGSSGCRFSCCYSRRRSRVSVFLVAAWSLGVRLDTAVAAQPDLEVIGRADSIGQAARQLRCRHADVVVLDAGKATPHRGDLDALLTSGGVRPASVLLIVAEDEPGWVTAAARAGIRGITGHDAPPQDIPRAIRSIAAGEPHISPGLAGRLFDYVAGLPTPACDETVGDGEGLTPREAEVLRLVSRGLSNAAIAESLCITVRTTKYHVSNLLGKLGLRNRTELALHVSSSLAAR
ncbi:LuxR C-terminal-related transcriptional regulator [Actinacidiphila paucisporea]|uniref:DNA-binding response regulator, NarL/FixJ family, contains REC and HTH domains n=1 Tax=Actinacidiphila paucisporea TaxID=310782 RepID=A0A1M7HBA5_9ACTN|nr:response regulator transcription factor [Actinacidiphila paucisporea]SHM25666.1 DNA-binding response regulator, NarL/FixJ family, contains REC and HTH domains [Actinacidiphila paucisporea]